MHPSHQEALCDLLDQGGKDSLEVALCLEATKISPRAFWAFRRLGFLLVSSFHLFLYKLFDDNNLIIYVFNLSLIFLHSLHTCH
jgi:hypothetical protein